MNHRIRVFKNDAGERIDNFLVSNTNLSRSSIQRIIKEGCATVNNITVKCSYKLKAEETIEYTLPEKKPSTLSPEPVPIDILYEDKYIIVVNKPPGIVMYPAPGHTGGTLMNAIVYHVKNLATIGAPMRPGVVHRIDKDTSGIVVVALTDEAYYGLVRQFKDKSIKRKYLCLIYGHPKEDRGEIALSIGRSPVNRKKMSTRSKKGRPAKTIWRVLKKLREAALIEAQLSTGRTHQIRVHFSALGYTVLGDKTYGRMKSIKHNDTIINIPRQMLHAETLGIKHPVEGKWLEFHSPLPEDMKEVIKYLEVPIL